MPIDAYVGKPGHGKSYGVVEHVVIPSLKQGRHVVTNIPLMVDWLLEDFGGFITQLPEDWHSRPDLADLAPPGCVLILDELWRRWPAGIKANQVQQADKALLAEHRHRVDKSGKSMRIVLVTQGLEQVASFARTLIEQTYRITKKTKKRFRCDIYSGAATGDRPPKSQKVRETYGSYKPEVYRYYKSATQSETGEVGDESKADTRGSFWRSPLLWLIVTVIPVLFGSGLWAMRVYLAPLLDQGKSASAAAPVLVNPPPDDLQPARRSTTERTAQALTGVNSGPVMSASWRVAGAIQRSSEPPDRVWPSRDGYNAEQAPSRKFLDDQVMLSSTAGHVRYIPAAKCSRFEDGVSWSCVVDGETVTPWTGRGAVTRVIDPESSASRSESSRAGSERSDRTALDDPGPASAPRRVVAQSAPERGSGVTVVSDAEFASRPWH